MGRKVLLISDRGKDDCISVIKKLLETRYEIIEHSGSAHLDSIHTSIYLIILVLSQESNSVHLITQLLGVKPKTPILCLAKNLGSEFIIKAFRSGISDFIEEPFTEQELIAGIKRICPDKRVFQLKNRIANLLQPDVRKLFKNHRNDTLKKTHNDPVDHVHAENQPEALDSNIESNENKLDEKPINLSVNFFGRLQVHVNNREIVDWKGKKSRQLFSYLAYKNNPVFREVLMEQLWPNSSPASARNCLHVTVNQVRTSLQQVNFAQKFIIFKDDCYYINPEIYIETDVSQLKKHWQKARLHEAQGEIEKSLREYEKAAALYTGNFLTEFQYDSWCDLDRENLKETNILILNKLSHYFSLDGKPRSAIELCNKILLEDRCREDIHRRLMRSYYRIGQKDRALRQYQKCVDYLRMDLDAEPSQITTKLYKKIKEN